MRPSQYQGAFQPCLVLEGQTALVHPGSRFTCTHQTNTGLTSPPISSTDSLLTLISSHGLTSWHLLQALQFDRLGPDRSPYSIGRQKRLAVQEAATALVCTMLPAIEPVVHVTIKPREKYPLGQTVLRVNEQRELTKQFTRQYLEEQLLTTLAGTAVLHCQHAGFPSDDVSEDIACLSAED